MVTPRLTSKRVAVLTDSVFEDNNPFTLHFDFRNAEVADLVQLAGLPRPSAGSPNGFLNVTINVSGTRASPHGDGQLELRNGVAYGVNIPSLKSDLRISEGELQFNNIESTVYNAPLSGSAAIGLSNLTNFTP